MLEKIVQTGKWVARHPVKSVGIAAILAGAAFGIYQIKDRGYTSMEPVSIVAPLEVRTEVYSDPAEVKVYDSLVSSQVNYSGNVPLDKMEDVQEVLQRGGVFSSSESEHPIIATYGIGPCVAVAGYSKELKRGFVVHVDSMTDRTAANMDDPYWAPKSLGKAVFWGSKDVDGLAEYDVRIIQGQESPELLQSVEKYIRDMNKWTGDRVRFNVIERDVDSGINGSKNIALDLRDGKVYHYKPLDNPHGKEISPLFGLSIATPSPINWKIDDSLKTKAQ